MKPLGNICFALALLSTPASHAAEATPATATRTESLNEVLRDWIQINRDTQKLTADWENDKAILKAHQTGIRQELKALDQDIAEEQPYAKERDLILGETQSKIAAYRATREEFAKQLPDLEDKAHQLYLSLPGLLSEGNPNIREAGVTLATQIKARGSKDFDPGKELNKRLLAVMSILTEVEKFNNTVKLKSEAMDGVNVDTVYFGIGQAYRADENGTKGWIGRIVDGRFLFTTSDEHATAIRELIDVQKEEEEARMIELPLRTS